MRELINCKPPKYYYSFEKATASVRGCITCGNASSTGGYFVFHNGIRGNGVRMEKSYSGVVCSDACMNMYKLKLLNYNIGLYE